MASTKFESDIKEIPFNEDQVYGNLSDLNNLERVKDRIPSQVSNFAYDRDSVSVNVAPFGDIKVRIVNRQDDPKCIKFEAEKSPVPFNMWIQLLPTSQEACKMRLTMKAELNPILKGMLAGPMKQGLDKIAEALTKINYGSN